MNSIAAKLLAELKSGDPFAIAFSGGCDSTLLAEAARRAFGAENVLLLLADSLLLPRREREMAEAFARRTELHLEVISFDPLPRPEIAANTPLRCYHCKKAIFSALLGRAEREGFDRLADGTNADDLGDYRPGLRAADELGVLHPFLNVGMTKTEVRELSRRWELPTWNLPAAACLASRIPTGTPLTREALRQVEKAEEALHRLGLATHRVRKLGDRARVETAPEEQSFTETHREAIIARLRQCGFAEVEFAPYQRGAMNQA